MYIESNATIVSITIAYIAPTDTWFPKKYRLQSTESLTLSKTSAGTPILSISLKAPFIAWFLMSDVPYVPGKHAITFCKPLLKLDMGIYAPHINP